MVPEESTTASSSSTTNNQAKRSKRHTSSSKSSKQKKTTTKKKKTKTPKEKRNQSIYFVPDGTDETYEKYERDRGLALYAEAMSTIVLPSHSLRLVQHFIELAKFVDDLDERITQELAAQRLKSATNNNKTHGLPAFPWRASQSPKKGCDEMDEEGEEQEAEDRSSVASSSSEESTMASIDERDVAQMNVKRLCAIAWRWHDAVIKIKEPLTGDYAYTYVLAWVQFCRLYNAGLRWHDDGVKARRYTDCRLHLHPYNKAIASSHCIVVSHDPVGEYSMRDMYESARLVVSTLYSCQFSTQMHDYVHTIFFRYTTFLGEYHNGGAGDDGDDDSEEEERLADLFDDPSFVLYTPPSHTTHQPVNNARRRSKSRRGKTGSDDDVDEMTALGEAYDGFKQLVLTPVHPNYSIRFGYVEAGELLFRLQLTRLDLSRKLQALATRTATLVQPVYRVRTDSYVDALQQCMKACGDSITELSTHKILRDSVCEDYMRQLTRVHLYHGEQESFERASPGASNGPDDVLDKLRPNDNIRVHQIRKMPIPTLVTLYSESMRRVLDRVRDQQMNGRTDGDSDDDDDGDGDLFMRIDRQSRVATATNTNLFVFHCAQYERELVLLTRVVTTKWLDYETYKHIDEMKEAFIIEEMSDDQLVRISQLITDVATATANVQRNTNNNNSNSNTRHRKGRRQLPPRKRLPRLVKLMQVYYTVDLNGPGEPRVFASHFFVEAYVAWLAQCANHGLLNVTQLYRPLQAVVGLFRGRDYFFVQ